MSFSNVRKPASKTIRGVQAETPSCPFLCTLKAMYCVFIPKQNMLVFMIVNQSFVVFY